MEHFERFSDIGVGSGRTSRSLVWSAFCCRVLQGLPQSIDDRGNVARADIAASASASRSDGWYPHEVALDQLHRVQGRNRRVAHSKLFSPRMGRTRDFT